MRSLPSGSVEVVTVAIPPVTVEVPSVVEPLVNVTVPVALLGSVSVKVTAAPGRDGLTEEVSVDANSPYLRFELRFLPPSCSCVSTVGRSDYVARGSQCRRRDGHRTIDEWFQSRG